MVKAQVVVDRLGPRIQAEVRELLAESDDLILEGIGRAVRDPPRGPGPGDDRLVTTLPETPDQLADVAFRHAVGHSDLPVAPALEHDRVHHVASQIHRRLPS